MTLQEAINSGKFFTRPSFDGTKVKVVGGIFEDSDGDEFVLTPADITATDYTLAAESTFSITESEFKTIWNSARSGLLSVKDADNSPMAKKLLAIIKERHS
jgi:hypothetical protein